MKHRTGFVSNSSSASFIITVPLPTQSLLEMILQEAGYGVFMSASFIESLKADKKQNMKHIKSMQSDSNKKMLTVRKEWITTAENRIKKIDELIAFASDGKNPRIEVLKKQLEYNELDIKEKIGVTSIEGSTSMWNGLDDAGPLIPMISAMLTMMKVRHTFEVESDN